MSDPTYQIQLGPSLAPESTDANGETRYAMVLEPTIFEARAVKIRYVKDDPGHFELIDSKGQITFSAPIHMLVWMRKVEKMGTVTPIKTNLRLVEDMGENQNLEQVN